MGRKRKEKLQRKTERAAGRPAHVAPPPLPRVPLRLSAAALAIFAAVFIIIAVSAFLKKSTIVDEPVHLLAGYSYLKWGDFRLNPEHPPLAKILAALPILARGPRTPPPMVSSEARYLSGTITARELSVYFSGVPLDRLFFYPKLLMVLVAVALGAAIFAWTKELFGFEAAAAALLLYALDPNILAHSQIVHTDLPFAAASFAAVYYLWRVTRRLTWTNLSLFCLFFALTPVIKHSFVALLPSLALLGAAVIFSPEPLFSTIGQRGALSHPRAKAPAVAAIFFAAALAAYFFVWMVYGFRYHAGPNGASVPIAAMPSTPMLRALVSVLVDLHLFPHAWIDGQVFNLTHLRRTAYLLGTLSDTGFWSYFPVIFTTKTPLPTLALLLAAIYFIARRKIAGATAFFLLTPAAVYFILAVISRMNIGLRHILQIYPFLFVLAGAAAAELWKRSRVARPGVVALGLWLAVEAAIIYPDHLAYFNELAGGAKNGYRVAVDSNLDWGQDLKGLRRFLDERGIGKIYLSYFGTADPCFYKIDFIYITALPPRPEACGSGKPGTETADFLAVSATNRFLTRNFYEWLASYKPIAQVGQSIFVYDFHGDRAAHKQIGVVYLKSEEIDEARREFAVAGEPMSDKLLARIDLGDDPGRYMNLAAMFFKKGLVAEATAMLEHAARLNPNDAAAHTNLGGIYLTNSRIDRAIEEFDAALKIDPTSAEAHNNLGTAYLRKGRADLAYTHYSEAVRLKPDLREAAENLKLTERSLAAQRLNR